MDIATILGIVSAFGLVVTAIFLGSGLELFISIPSLMIVLGGTFGSTMINYPLKQVIGVLSVVKNAFFKKTLSSEDLIKKIMELSHKARKEGILSLEADIKDEDDAFLQKGVQLSIDGLEPPAISDLLETEIDFIRNRHQQGAEVFTTMGTYAPAMGMIGTLIGLVQMLQSMDDPSTIGPAMAVALLTTFYGSVLANIVFMPIAGKLRTRSKEEMLVKELTIQGIISLTKGDNPRSIEQKLNAFLPPNMRETS